MTPTEIRRRVREAFDFWRPVTGADRWTITLRWAAVPDGGEEAVAGLSATPEYLTAELTVDVLKLRMSYDGRTARHISYLILHELCHALTWELVEYGEPHAPAEPFRKAMERSTCMIARAIWVARFKREPPE